MSEPSSLSGAATTSTTSKQSLIPKTSLLLATEAVLRESNLNGITHIIQFDTPELDQDYLARLASEVGKIITFISPSDQPRLEKLRTLTELEILTEIDPDFPYDKYSQQVKSAPIKGHVANKSKSIRPAR